MRWKIGLALLVVYIAWGSTYFGIRVAVETIPPFVMAGMRHLTAGALLYAWRRRRGDPSPTRQEWAFAALVGLFLLLGGNGSVSWAEQFVPSGIAALIVGASPLWMVTIDALRPGGKRPNLLTLAGVLLGFAGIAVLVSPSFAAIAVQAASGAPAPAAGAEVLGPAQMTGILALLLAGFTWAVGSLIGRSARLPSSPMLSTGAEMLAGGAGLLLVGGLAGEWGRLDLAAISGQSWLALVYLIVAGSLGGFTAYTWLLRVVPTPLAATYAYVNPLIAVLLGSLLLGELLTGRVLVATVVIVASVVLINFARDK